MTKKELVKAVATSTSYTQKDVAVVIDSALEIIANTIAAEEVSLTGFGKFSVVERDQREMRNPATGEIVVVPAKKAPKFKASTTLKATVNA